MSIIDNVFLQLWEKKKIVVINSCTLFKKDSTVNLCIASLGETWALPASQKKLNSF